MKAGYTVRWFRRGDTVRFHIGSHQLARSWRTLGAYQRMRLRVLARAEELAAAIALAEK